MVSQRHRSGVILVVLCWLPGCSGGPTESSTIRQAERLTLYEGLPHPMYEPVALTTEKNAKPTVELHGFPFYRETLDLKAGDDQKLKAVLGDARTFSPFAGEKKCGGFHPDYAVEWSVGGKIHICLICFGCGEVMIYGSKSEARYDIRSDARATLQDLLRPYRKSRPTPNSPGL